MTLDNELAVCATHALVGWNTLSPHLHAYDPAKRLYVVQGSRILSRAIQMFERIAESIDPLQENQAITTLRTRFISFHNEAKQARERYRVCEYARK